MLVSPYPASRTVRVLISVGWVAGVASGIWVMVAPPQPYSFLGEILTTVWGVMLVAGCAVAGAGWVLRRYQVETPGLILALGGVAIYDLLSWEMAVSGTHDSGPRALLLVLPMCVIAARTVTLIRLDAQLRRRVEEEQGA